LWVRPRTSDAKGLYRRRLDDDPMAINVQRTGIEAIGDMVS
jgi:hypothetical protein